MTLVGRLILALYPERSRRNFGAELATTVSLSLVDAAELPLARRLRAVSAVYFDLAKGAVLEWGAWTLAGFQGSGGGRAAPGGPGHLPRRFDSGGFRFDLQVTLRRLWRAPGFTVGAVSILALAVGVNTAVFGMVRGVLVDELGYDNPQELVAIWSVRESVDRRPLDLSQPDFVDLKVRTRALQDVAAQGVVLEANLSRTGADARVDQVGLARVTANFFSLFGVRMTLGRDFFADGPSGDAAAPGRFAVLSSEYWAQAFASDPTVVGEVVSLDNEPVEILGVLPRGFSILESSGDRGIFARTKGASPDLWMVGVEDRRAMDGMEHMRILPALRVFGRLRAGVDLEEARVDLARIADELRSEHAVHAQRGSTFGAAGLRDDVTAGVRPSLLTLWGMVLSVLLIACGNVAGLSLVRAARRRREFMIQAALGGGRLRLMRQLLLEGGVIALAAVGLGLLIAWAGSSVLLDWGTRVLPRPPAMRVDTLMMAFLGAMTSIVTVSVGVLPALRSTSGSIHQALAEHGRGLDSRRSRSGRDALILGQVAGSVALMVVAGVMLQSFVKLEGLDLGFEANTDQLVSVRVALPGSSYRRGPERRAYLEELSRRLEALPEIEAAANTWPVPMAGEGLQMRFGATGDELESNAPASYRTVGPGYLGLIGARLVEGRMLEEGDESLRPVPVVISQAAAEVAFGSLSPVGRSLVIEQNVDMRVDARVVGVVETMVETDPLAGVSRPALYVPYGAVTAPRITWVLLRTVSGTSLRDVSDRIREAAEAVDPSVGTPELRTVESYRSDFVAPIAFAATLMVTLGGVGLALAMIGLFASMASMVHARTREIGVKMALGARRASIRWEVLRRALGISGVGIAVGLFLGVESSRVIQASTFEGAGADAETVVVVTLIVLAMSLLASWVPASRAMAVEPVRSLAAE